VLQLHCAMETAFALWATEEFIDIKSWQKDINTELDSVIVYNQEKYADGI